MVQVLEMTKIKVTNAVLGINELNKKLLGLRMTSQLQHITYVPQPLYCAFTCIYYPLPRSSEVCGQIYPSCSAWDIFDHKIPLTSVSGSI